MASGEPKMGPLGHPWSPLSSPRNVWELSKVPGIQGQGVERSSLDFPIAQSGWGDRHITVSGTEASDEEIQ